MHLRVSHERGLDVRREIPQRVLRGARLALHGLGAFQPVHGRVDQPVAPLAACVAGLNAAARFQLHLKGLHVLHAELGQRRLHSTIHLF